MTLPMSAIRVSNQPAKNNLKGYNSIMEKSVPHCKLAVVKAVVATGKIRTTFSARQGALELGLDEHGICSVVEALSDKDFHKSMTTHADHRLWQDVYRPTTPVGMYM